MTGLRGRDGRRESPRCASPASRQEGTGRGPSVWTTAEAQLRSAGSSDLPVDRQPASRAARLTPHSAHDKGIIRAGSDPSARHGSCDHGKRCCREPSGRPRTPSSGRCVTIVTSVRSTRIPYRNDHPPSRVTRVFRPKRDCGSLCSGRPSGRSADVPGSRGHEPVVSSQRSKRGSHPTPRTGHSPL